MNRSHILTAFFGFLLLFLAGCGDGAPETVELTIASEPAGAAITVDGAAVGSAPVKYAAPRGAALLLRAELPGRETVWRQAIADDSRQLLLTLPPEHAPVLLDSTPAGADVLLNGAPVGRTPLVVADLEMGHHQAIMRKDGYADRSVEWTLADRYPRRIAVEFESTRGRLSVTSTPAGAKVFVDNRSLGVTPCSGEFPEGEHTLRLSLDGFTEHEERITLVSKETLTRDFNLNAMPGSLEITSDPDGATVFIDGEARGSTPLILSSLPVGRYRLEVAKDGYGMEAADVTIASGQTIKRDVRLIQATGGFDLTVTPAGVEVFIDGRELGASDGVTAFKVRGLGPGKHIIRTRHARADPEIQEFPIEIRRGEVQSVRTLNVWVANAEITTTRPGEILIGYLEEEPATGRLWYSPGPGLRMVISRNDIQSIKWLDREEE